MNGYKVAFIKNNKQRNKSSEDSEGAIAAKKITARKTDSSHLISSTF